MNSETRAERIKRKLVKAFAPTFLDVKDESSKHLGHAGHRAEGESHFRVKIISPAFKELNKIARHRAIYDVLAEDMQEGGIHALALEVLDAPLVDEGVKGL